MKIIRCSGLARRMQCAGSLFLPEEAQESGRPAQEGTACGELLEHRLTRANQAPPDAASNGVGFDQDMHFYTKLIAEDIFSKANSQILCEQRIDWVARGGITIKGQYDASYVGKDGRLYIDDLKYGWGLVEVKENWQLLGYAIGEVMRRGAAFDVVLRIHQPRPHHEDGSTREWCLTYDELLTYKEQIDSRMEKIANGFNELATGKYCAYCPSAVSCPALNKAFWRGVDIVHECTEDAIDDKELAFQLDLIGRVSEVMKVKLGSLEQLAVNRIKGGAIIPGYITEQRLSDRKWAPFISPEIVKLLTGVNIVEEVMLSPAKAAKIGLCKHFIAQSVERHQLGQKLVKKDAGAVGDKIFGKEKPS